jgi:hypothetical protein
MLVFLPEMEWRGACPAGDGGVPLRNVRMAFVGGRSAWFDAPNIFLAGYEFEGDPASIS